MTSLLLAFCVQQSVLKDIHILAAPLDKVIRQLSEVYNSPMDVSNLIKNQIVLIDASQVSEQDVRNHIASTLNASWEKKENGWHLTKTRKQVKEDEQRMADIRIRFLRKTFDLRTTAEGSKAKYSPAFAAQTFNQFRNQAKNRNDEMQPPGPTAAGYGLPNQRFMSKFLLKFGLERIAAVSTNKRVVYALHPNAMQVKLDTKLDDEIAQFNSEQATWMKTFMEMSKDEESRAKQTGSTNEVGVAMAVSNGDDDSSYNSSFQAMPPDVANILFTIYCSQDGTYSLKLIAVPTDSKQPAFSVSATTFEGAFAGMTADDFQVKPVPEFKLSQNAADFRQFFERKAGQIPDSRRKAMIEQFANPVANDPLSYGLSESIIFDAHRMKRNIFACLDDLNINIFEPIFADTWFQERFRILNEGIVLLDDHWIGMRKFPYSEPNIPRIDLKTIITRVRQNGKVNIWDRAALAALRPRTNSYSYIEGMLEIFVNGSRDEQAEDDALKCLGMLTDAEQNAALKPGGVPYSQLNSRLQNHLFQCAYYNEHNRLWATQGGTAKNMPQIMTQEPTLIAPNGILADSIFVIEEKSEDQIKDSDGPGSIGLMTDAKGWGSTKYQIEHPEDYPGINFKFDVTRKLSRVKVRTWTIKLKVNSACEWSSLLQTVDIVAKDAFTISSLPEDLKADFDAGYKASADYAKKQRERQKKDGGGGTSR